MNDILKELSGLRRTDAEGREKTIPMSEMMRRAMLAPTPRDFAAVFRRGGVNVIAELKRASPSEGMIREEFIPAALAKELEHAGAGALSVLCEPHRFLGGEEYLSAARGVTSLPVLYKDFVTSRYQVAAARAAGADAVLLIAAVLDNEALADLLGFAHEVGLRALVETHDVDEVKRAVQAGAGIVGVNCRDLRNFSTDVSLLERLIGEIPRPCLRIAESGIRDAASIERVRAAGADGFLIGTALMRAQSPAAALADLINQSSKQ